MLLSVAGAGQTRSAARLDTAPNPDQPLAALAWDPRFYLGGPDGPGLALLADEENLFVGGSFSSLGSAAIRSIARFDGSAWTPVGSGIEGSVRTLCRYRGELIAGGAFLEAGGLPAARVARWNGDSWSPLGSGVDGVIRSTAIFGDDLVVAGDFDSAGGIPAARIAKWNGERWQALGEGLPESVTGVAVFRGELYAACLYYFGSGNDRRMAYVSRWDGSTWEPVAVGDLVLTWGAWPSIDGLFVHQDRLFALGNKMFFTGGGSGLCSWDGSVWRDEGGYGRSDLDDGSSPVYAATAWRGDLVVGGSFGVLEPEDRAGIAIQSSSGWTPCPGGGVGGAVFALTEFQGTLFVAGGFDMAGSVVAPNLAQHDGQAWHTTTESGQGVIGTVMAVAWLDHDVIIGGHSIRAGNLPVQNIMRWDGNRWQPLGAGLNGSVRRLIPFAGGIVAAGGFLQAGDVDAARIAFWDGTDWSPLGAGLEGGGVSDIIEFQGQLIAGGRFQTTGGGSVPYVAQWDSQEWRPMPGLDGTAICLTSYGGRLVAGGDFSGNLSLWTGTGWRLFGSGVHTRVNVLAGRPYGLFLGGGYSYSVPNAWWDGDRWRSLRFEGYRVAPESFADHAGMLLCGVHVYYSDTPSGLFAWGDSAFVMVPDGPTGTVRALSSQGSALALGGDFTRAGGTSSWNFALARDPTIAEATDLSVTRRDTTAIVTWRVYAGGEFESWRVHREEAGGPRVLLTPNPLSGRVAYELVDPGPPLGDSDYWLEQVVPAGSPSTWYGPTHLTARLVQPCCETMRITPNPTDGPITVQFSLVSPGSIQGVFFDTTGRRVAETPLRFVSAGEHEIHWDPRSLGPRPLPSGVYWLRIVTTEGSRTERVVWRH